MCRFDWLVEVNSEVDLDSHSNARMSCGPKPCPRTLFVDVDQIQEGAAEEFVADYSVTGNNIALFDYPASVFTNSPIDERPPLFVLPSNVIKRVEL